jgi:hypothetical protein
MVGPRCHRQRPGRWRVSGNPANRCRRRRANCATGSSSRRPGCRRRGARTAAIEALAGDDRLNTVTRLAIGAAELLERIALRARHADPGFGALADAAARLRTGIAEALGRL